jgi:hypothetical protein
VSSTTLAEVARGVDGARVVSTSGLEVLGAFLSGLGLVALLETVTCVGACGAVLDHRQDLRPFAWGCLDTVLVAGAESGVALHKTGVQDTVVGGLNAHTTLTFLHDNGKDECRIDAGFSSDLRDAFFEIKRFLVGVVARRADKDLIEIPAGYNRLALGYFHASVYLQPLERQPLVKGWPSIRGIAVTTHDSICARGAIVQVVVGLRAMGNGCNESWQAASSQDLLRY